MQRHFIKLGLLLGIAAVWWAWRSYALAPSRVSPPPPAATSGSAAPTGSAAAPTPTATGSGSASAAPSAPSAHVRTLRPEERARLVEQIRAAQAARAARGSATAGSAATGAAGSADHSHDLDRASAPLRAALEEAIPSLAACYEQPSSGSGSGSGSAARPGSTAIARLTLTNDPDIGAVVDADQIVDDKRAPLPAALDACLRGAIQTLALPPLPAGDTIQLEYSFAFTAR